jgi:hypothetical protein
LYQLQKLEFYCFGTEFDTVYVEPCLRISKLVHLFATRHGVTLSWSDGEKKYWFLRWSWPVWKSIPVIFTRAVENQTTVLWSRSMIQMDSVGIFTLRFCSFIWEVTVTQWPSSPNGTYCFLLRIGKWGRQMVHPSGFGVPQKLQMHMYIYIYLYLFTYTHDIFCDPSIQNMCTCMQCNAVYVMYVM